MIWSTLSHYKILCRGDHRIDVQVQFIQQHTPVNFLQKHLWHKIKCHWYIHSLRYPNHIIEQMTLHHHRMVNYRQQASHLHKILRHTTTHPKWYHRYQLNMLQIQVCWILNCWKHLTHLTPGILNKETVRIRYAGVKGATMTLLKIAPISHQGYTRLYIIPRSQNLNCMGIPYGAEFISSLS